MELKKVSSFSHRLKEILAESDISITEFAKRLSYSKQAISAYVNGTRSPKRPVVITIAQMLNVSEMWLCGYDVSKERTKPTDDPKTNQIIAISRGGDKVQYDLTEAELQAVLTILDGMKKK